MHALFAQAIGWGITHEPRAKQVYTQMSGRQVKECGVFLSPSGLLGGSPDGMIAEDHIVEVKCPWSCKDKTVLQAAENSAFYMELDDVTGGLRLKESSPYWHQIQGNMFLSGADKCDFIVWTEIDTIVVLIHKDHRWSDKLVKLEKCNKSYLYNPIL